MDILPIVHEAISEGGVQYTYMYETRRTLPTASHVSQRLFNVARKLHWTDLLDMFEYKRTHGHHMVVLPNRKETLSAETR